MSAVQASPEHRATWALLKLAALRHPDRIATALHEKGVRGGHGSRDCPLAHYIRIETGLKASVRPRHFRVDDTDHWWTLPEPLVGFVSRFSRDHYPQLLAHLETEGEPA